MLVVRSGRHSRGKMSLIHIVAIDVDRGNIVADQWGF